MKSTFSMSPRHETLARGTACAHWGVRASGTATFHAPWHGAQWDAQQKWMYKICYIRILYTRDLLKLYDIVCYTCMYIHIHDIDIYWFRYVYICYVIISVRVCGDCEHLRFSFAICRWSRLPFASLQLHVICGRRFHFSLIDNQNFEYKAMIFV